MEGLLTTKSTRIVFQKLAFPGAKRLVAKPRVAALPSASIKIAMGLLGKYFMNVVLFPVAQSHMSEQFTMRVVLNC